MTFDSLANQTATIYRKPTAGTKTTGGLATGSASTEVGTARGRLALASARQVAMWTSLGIFAEYNFITKSSAVRNGDVLTITDQFGRSYGTFRVTGGAGFPRVGEGGIQTYWNYPISQTDR